jgi:hypothetical protein
MQLVHRSHPHLLQLAASPTKLVPHLRGGSTEFSVDVKGSSNNQTSIEVDRQPLVPKIPTPWHSALGCHGMQTSRAALLPRSITVGGTCGVSNRPTVHIAVPITLQDCDSQLPAHGS